jgi:hypothetical protein
MELLGDVGHVASRFGPFGDSVSVVARKVHGLCQPYQRIRNHLGRTRWNSKVTRLKWMLISFCLEILLILTHDRCTICAERTTGSDIILDVPDGIPR